MTLKERMADGSGSVIVGGSMQDLKAGWPAKDWVAVEMSTDLTGREYRLTVTGLVETTDTNILPHLAEARPQGINPTVLLLELSVISSGLGGHSVGWKNVEFGKIVSPGQYVKVSIVNGSESHPITVEKALT